MKLKRGIIVESDFGSGPVVAITKEWLIHSCDDGHEIAIPINEGGFWIPAEVENADLPEDVTLVIKNEEPRREKENEK